MPLITDEQNLIVLGDFNIEVRGDLLHQTFIAEGLHIHPDMANPEVTHYPLWAEFRVSKR
jgi:hypothetical protein